MERLSSKQAAILASIREDAGRYSGAVASQTASALIRRGLVSTSPVPENWNMAGAAFFTITPTGAVALEHHEKPARSVGRPRKHPDQAVKQWEYRRRKGDALDDLEKWVGYAAAAGDKLAGEVRSGRSGSETLRNLIEHFKAVAGEGRNSQAAFYASPLFDASPLPLSFMGPGPDDL